jgi:hypothetical protein
MKEPWPWLGELMAFSNQVAETPAWWIYAGLALDPQQEEMELWEEVGVHHLQL